jgi:hypothetical protein
MADEVNSEGSQSEVSSESQSHVAEGQAPEHQQPDSLESAPIQQEEGDTHPLEPGGDRFKQIYARAKEAERRKDELAAELQREREERIRLEERQKVREESAAPPEREYSWNELEVFISEGKLTRAQAQTYRESLIEKKAKAEAAKLVEGHLNLNTREVTVGRTLDRYKELKPEMMTPGSPERKRLESEYQFLVGTLGYPATLQTQLAAARAAFGDVSVLETQAKLKAKHVEREGHMETHTNQRPPAKAKDPIATLSPEAKEHYTRMIKAGRYGSYQPRQGVTDGHWEAVRAELTWTRGKKK